MQNNYGNQWKDDSLDIHGSFQRSKYFHSKPLFIFFIVLTIVFILQNCLPCLSTKQGSGTKLMTLFLIFFNITPLIDLKNNNEKKATCIHHGSLALLNLSACVYVFLTFCVSLNKAL